MAGFREMYIVEDWCYFLMYFLKWSIILTFFIYFSIRKLWGWVIRGI